MLLIACSRPAPPTPPVAPIPPASIHILSLTEPDHPTLLQAATHFAKRREAVGGTGPLLTFDAFPVNSVDDTTAVVRRQLPQIHRYRAVYVNSITYARAAQLLLPPDLPIVFEGVADPSVNCLVDSLRRPGRNATGYMHLLPNTELKMLEALHDGFPGIRRVLMLLSGHNLAAERCDGADPASLGLDKQCVSRLHDADDTVERLTEARAIADFGRRRGLAVQFLVLCRPADFQHIASHLAGVGDVGVLVPWHSLFDDNVPRLVSALAPAGRPAVYPNRRFPEAGGTLSLEPILDRGVDRASLLALMEVLGGRATASLPVQAPRGFHMVLNVGAMAQQGLQPSALLLRRADRLLP